MADDVFGIVGSVIAGAYQVETVVAEGGFAVVYRAFHTGFRAPIALKCLKIPEQFSERHQEEFLEQFRAEAVLLFRLSASIPTVVRPLHIDAFTNAEGMFVPFMALEWLEGETLDAIVLRRQQEGRAPFTLKKLMRLLTPVARALERAHNFNSPEGFISIVHRDLKPENIFVASVAGEQTVKILDFGIGKAKSVASQVAGRASQTVTGLSSFTPAYGAPEQWLPKRFGQTGAWTDVWGLALTMVETLAARPIVDGDQAEMMSIVLSETRRPTPRGVGLEISDAAEAVFLRALSVDPRDRYPEAGAFWSDLVQALGMSEELGMRSSAAPRDARSEGGVVQLVDHIEAAMPRASYGPGVRGSAPTRSGRPLTPSLASYPSRASNVNRISGSAARRVSTPGAPPPELSRLSTPSAMPGQNIVSSAPPGRVSAPGDAAVPGAPRVPMISETGLRRERSSAPPMQADPQFNPAAGGPMDLAVDPDWNQRATRPSRPPQAASGSPLPIPPAGSDPPVPPERISSAPGDVQNAPYPGVPHGAHRRPYSSRPPRPGSIRPGPSQPPGPSRPPSVPPQFVASDFRAPEPPSLVRRLMPGLVLVGLSIALTLFDQAYAASSGTLFSIGPVRAPWLAALLMIGGIGIGAYRGFGIKR
jgi:serine/threonine-protein kinase